MAEIQDHLRGKCCDIVLDLLELHLLTSSGISKLLRLRKRMIEGGRRRLLCSPQDKVWGVFMATGPDGIFEFAETITEALTRLQGGKGY